MRALLRHTWLIHLTTIACCAFFAARAAGQLVAGLLEGPGGASSSRGSISPVQTSDPPATRTIQTIVGRNIFCSTCERAIADETTSDPAAAASSSGAPVRTALKLQLLATLVSEEDPASSIAYILDGEQNQTRLYSVGAKVGGQATIVEVSARQVLLLHGGRHEYLPLGEGAAEARTGSTPVASAEYAMPEPMAGMESVAEGIKRVGGSRYTIQRSMVNKVLSDPTLLARSARLVPALQNGEPNGFTVYARPGSLPSLLGLFNGDVLQAINGHAITTPDKALEVMKSLRNASHLTLSFARKGVQLTHDYDIQ